MNASTPQSPGGPAPHGGQFGLGAMLGGFVAVAMGLAYLRRFDSASVFLNGMIVMMLAGLLGVIVGSLVKRPAETIFWSLIIAAAGYLSVVGEARYGVGFHFAWSAVGATSGAIAAAIPAGRLIVRMVAACLGGTAVMLIYYLGFSPRVGLEFDVLAATIVGAMIGLLVEIIMWVEQGSKIPRYVTASWLLCAVIVGNLLVPWVLS